MDEEFPELCPVRTIIIYQSRKTNLQLSPTFSFFLTVKQSAEKSPNDHPHWYSNHPMGVNMISSLFKKATRSDILQGQALFRGVKQLRKKEKKKKRKKEEVRRKKSKRKK